MDNYWLGKIYWINDKYYIAANTEKDAREIFIKKNKEDVITIRELIPGKDITIQNNPSSIEERIKDTDITTLELVKETLDDHTNYTINIIQ